MTFSKSRFLSIFLVLCVLLSLTFTFVSASTENISFVVDLMDEAYLGFLTDDQFSFFESAFVSSIPLSFSLDGVGIIVTDPSDYFLAPDSPVMVFSLFPTIMVGQEDFESFIGFDLTDSDLPSISVSVSGDFGSVPDDSDSGGLLSDLRLTGTAFLETVQGVVLSIVQNPLLLLTVGIFFFGGCVAIFGRLLSKD